MREHLNAIASRALEKALDPTRSNGLSALDVRCSHVIFCTPFYLKILDPPLLK